MKFAVSEAFLSVQGEGRYIGVPSIFLRMFGCNFKCEGFGMPRGKKSTERLAVNPINFTKFEDLPLVRTGCDSYASWDPRFKKFAKHYTPEELTKYLTDLTPLKSWGSLGVNENDVHLVITGGEPLLGWQKMYPELFSRLAAEGLHHITFETNGTQPLHPDLQQKYFSDITEFTFSISPKLSASGEKWEDAIKPKVVAGYFNKFANTLVYLKFVIDPNIPGSLSEVEKAVYTYNDAGVECPVYLMPVGGCLEEYRENSTKVAKMAMSRGWRYSPRLHVDLFGNAWGT